MSTALEPSETNRRHTSIVEKKARGDLILAAGRVRSKKIKRKKPPTKSHQTLRRHTSGYPQHPGDGDHLEMVCDETRPTR